MRLGAGFPARMVGAAILRSAAYDELAADRRATPTGHPRGGGRVAGREHPGLRTGGGCRWRGSPAVRPAAMALLGVDRLRSRVRAAWRTGDRGRARAHFWGSPGCPACWWSWDRWWGGFTSRPTSGRSSPGWSRSVRPAALGTFRAFITTLCGNGAVLDRRLPGAQLRSNGQRGSQTARMYTLHYNFVNSSLHIDLSEP